MTLFREVSRSLQRFTPTGVRSHPARASGRYTADSILLALDDGRVLHWDQRGNPTDFATLPPAFRLVHFIARVGQDRLVLVAEHGEVALVSVPTGGGALSVIRSVGNLLPLVSAVVPEVYELDFLNAVATEQGLWFGGERVRQSGPTHFFGMYYDFATGAVRGAQSAGHRIHFLDVTSPDRALARINQDYVSFSTRNGLVTETAQAFSGRTFGRVFPQQQLLTYADFVTVLHPRTNQPWLGDASRAGRAGTPAATDGRWDYLRRAWTSFAGATGMRLPAGVTATALPTSLPAQWVADLFNATYLKYEIDHVHRKDATAWTALGLERSRPEELRALPAAGPVTIASLIALLPCQTATTSTGP